MWCLVRKNTDIVLALTRLSDGFSAHMKEEESDRKKQRELIQETNKTLQAISEKVSKLETDLLLQQQGQQISRHESVDVVMQHIRNNYVTKEMFTERFRIFGIVWLAVSTAALIWVTVVY